MFKYAIATILILAASATVYVNVCPCVLVPGLWLSGERINSPIEDWSFANEVGLCQVEVRSWRPHSVNLNCMSTGPDLFISCSPIRLDRYHSGWNGSIAVPRYRGRRNVTSSAGIWL